MKRGTGAALPSPTPFRPHSKSPDLERIFLDHYDWLLGWARQLTRGTTEDAGDLVQDFYVRFVQMKSSPNFADEDQTRAYLYKALKNMFVSRKLRQGRDAISGLSVVDFDSIEAAVSSVDRSQLLYVRSDLAGICEYAIIRRTTSKAAAAFTLRYFFGYLPSEVASLLRINRATLDAFLQTARLEARAYLTRPGVLRFLDRRDKKTPAFPRHLPERSDELFVEIQRRILAERAGDCFTQEELSGLYLGDEHRPLNLNQGAHLVSCPFCLTSAVRLLKLPDLLLQFADESIGSGGDGGISEDDNLASGVMKLRRKLREVYEHRPKKLQIAVDGHVLGIQSINGAINSLQIKLQPLQQPSFIEVLSEQGVGLLYLDAHETPAVPESHAAAVDLSDGRQLSVSLAFSGDANTVEVYYYDPLFGSELDEPPSAPAPSEPESVETKAKATRWSFFRRRERSPLLDKFRVLSVAVCLVVMAAVGTLASMKWFRLHGSVTEPSAAVLLAQSANQDRNAIPIDGSVRRTFSLTVESPAGQVVQSGQVRYLHQSASPLTSIEFHGASGKLLAGQWVNREGEVRSYPAKQSTKHASGAMEPTPVVAGWQTIPDATSFRELSGGDSTLSVHQSGNEYIIDFTRQPQVPSPSIVEAELTLTDDRLHPVAQAFVVHTGDTTQKYVFKEVRYELLRADQVSEHDFAPPLAVTSDPVGGEQAVQPSSSHLLLAVLNTLSAYGAEAERAIDVERQSDGHLLVQGVLSSESQRQDLTRLLRSIQGQPHLQIALHSVDEPLPSIPPALASEVPQATTISDTPIPMATYLREHVAAHVGPPEASAAAIRDAANLIVQDGSRLRRETWWLGQIGDHYFSPTDLQEMSLSDQRSWLDLLAHHLNNCSSGLTRLRSDLFIRDDAESIADPHPFRNTGELALSTTRLAQYGERLDRLLQDSFTVSAAAADPLHAPEELKRLLAEMNREESALHITVNHLQQRPTPGQSK